MDVYIRLIKKVEVVLNWVVSSFVLKIANQTLCADMNAVMVFKISSEDHYFH